MRKNVPRNNKRGILNVLTVLLSLLCGILGGYLSTYYDLNNLFVNDSTTPIAKPLSRNNKEVTVDQEGSLSFEVISPNISSKGNLVFTPEQDMVVNKGNLKLSDAWADISGENLQIYGEGNTDIYLQPNGGQIGVGTTSPQYTLHVLGDVGFSGELMEGIVPWERLSNLPTISTGQGLEGGGELTEDITISLSNTSVDQGTYGSSEEIPVITVNSRGQITNATIERITIPDSVEISNTGNSDTVAASTSYVYTVNQDLSDEIDSIEDTNDYLDSVTFNTSTGVLTLGRTGALVDLTQSLDGRYLITYTETDPIWSSEKGSYFNLSEDETVTGRPSFNGGVSGSTSPFTVDSNTVVSNLNADLLDGQEGAYYLDDTDTDSKLAVDSGATPDYLGATDSSGVLRTSSLLTYTDGGDFVTLGLTYDMDQNVLTSSNVTFATVNTGSGAKYLGDGAVADGDTDSIPTSDQVYDFVTGLSSDDNYVDSVSFNTSTGVLTLGRTGALVDLTQSLDGRYLTSYTETDPVWISQKGDYFNLSEDETVTGRPSFNGGVSGITSPFTVDSNTVVSNLNVDLLDGQSGSYYLDDTDTDTNDYLDSVAFNTSTGVLTLGRTGALGDLTKDLDGRYLPLSGGTITGDINFTGNITEDGVEIFTGVIAAFNGSCPTGWTEYTDARGRAVIGAGQGSGLTNRPLASTGGEETHVLTIAEMPSHTHIQNAHSHTQQSHRHYMGSWVTGRQWSTSGGDKAVKKSGGTNLYTNYQTPTIYSTTATNQNTGGDDAHNNMQPYIALTYCQKQTGSDYAEWIPSNEDLQPATIVSIDLTKDETITASTKEYDSNVVGIVTTQPGWVIGEEETNSEAMALSGRVPVKVSLKNGNIQRGDPITTSSIKGVGMKATKTGPIIGKAMEELNKESDLYECTDTKTRKTEQCGTITVFVNPTMHVQDSFVLGATDSKEGFFNGLANIIGQITSTIINTSIDVLGVSDDKVDTQDLLSRIESLEENQPSQALIIKEKEDGSIELLGGKIIVEGDGTINMKRLAVKEDYSIGNNIISAGEKSVVISTKAISNNSKVFITPTSDTQDKQLYVTDIKEGTSFKVNIREVLDRNITFDWFIVEGR